MQALGLSVREIQQTVRACAHVRIPEAIPPYLQQFLVLRVRSEHPALARKVADLSQDQCAELFRLIRALQRAGREESP
ncbi:MAG TPA: hypothetical protein VGF55_23250 [Gemmataceae bacterium]